MEPVRAVPRPGASTPTRGAPSRGARAARLLREAGYEPQRIQERLATGDQLARSPELPAYLRRLGNADELAVLLRLFLLGVLVARERVDELVGAQLRARSRKPGFSSRTARPSTGRRLVPTTSC